MNSMESEIEFAMAEGERQSRRNAVAAIAKLSIAFGKEMPDEQIDLYINMLYDIPSDALQQAVDVIITTERFFPAIATIRAAALQDESHLNAEEAWAFVSRRIQTNGRMAGTTGLTAEMKVGIDACGGWMALCQSENPTGNRIAFVRAYSSSANRTRRQQLHNTSIPKRLRTAMKKIGKGDL